MSRLSIMRTLGWIGVFAAGFCSFSCKIAGDLELRGWDAGCECKADAGPCCDGCNYYEASDDQVCEATGYDCSDTTCGADTQKRMGEAICQGGTSACTGDITWGDWITDEICNSNQICETDEATYAECITCFSCTDEVCWLDCDPAGTCCEPDGSWTPDEVQQPDTELYWLRCPLGQDWDVVTCGCVDNPGIQNMLWCDAMGLVPNDTECLVDPITVAHVEICESEYGAGYRLPTRQEFVELLGNCDGDVLSGARGYCDTCAASTNCTNMFGPDTRYYWSSSYIDSNAWYAGFNVGSVYYVEKASPNDVRCVRSGP